MLAAEGKHKAELEKLNAMIVAKEDSFSIQDSGLPAIINAASIKSITANPQKSPHCKKKNFKLRQNVPALHHNTSKQS